MSLVTIPAGMALGLVSTPAAAYDGSLVGQISSIDLTALNNYDFRVSVTGTTANACGTGTVGWGYLNASAGNYQAYVSIIALAYGMGKSVTIYLTRDPGTTFCIISYVSVSG